VFDPWSHAMTLRVTITNEDGNPPHKVNVNVWEESALISKSGIETQCKNVSGECCELSPGESVTVTIWGNRGVTVVEQSVGT
jgi:hypothetical protein